MNGRSCPCGRFDCVRHGDCAACREHHRACRSLARCEKLARKERRRADRQRAKACKKTYENRYRHKLNMLWPGQVMLKAAGALLLAGLLLWWANRRTIALLAFGAAGTVTAVLLLLVAVELHQDRVLNEIAMRENAEDERGGREPGR